MRKPPPCSSSSGLRRAGEPGRRQDGTRSRERRSPNCPPLPLPPLPSPGGPSRIRSPFSSPTSGDYLGPPLNRVARLLDVGYGGQILLSQAAQELVRDHLPEGACL